MADRRRRRLGLLGTASAPALSAAPVPALALEAPRTPVKGTGRA